MTCILLSHGIIAGIALCCALRCILSSVVGSFLMHPYRAQERNMNLFTFDGMFSIKTV